MSETLLEMTQEILSDMDGDNVNSIFDTEDAEQVARIIISTYQGMMSNSNWGHTHRGLTLEPRGSTDFPTHVKVPDNVKELGIVNYDTRKTGVTRKQYTEVEFVPSDDFLRKTNNRNSDDTNTRVIVDDSGIELLIKSNQAPSFYTTFNDVDIVFDSYDSTVDATIQESKIQAQGYIMPVLELVDSAVPDLPVDAYAALKSEAKSTAQLRLRQIQDPKAEQMSERQQRWLSRKSWKVNRKTRYPNYGRHK